MVFHVTARVNAKAHWFTPVIRDHILPILARSQFRSDLELLAFIIMSNHLHLVVRQGANHLAQFLQPLLREIALLLQRDGRPKGHMFERRYRAYPCNDPVYLRTIIAYTHANAVTADICDQLADYRWSSHAVYSQPGLQSPHADFPQITSAVNLFASRPNLSPELVAADYCAYMDWYVRYRRLLRNGWAGKLPASPPCAAGDEFWLAYFGTPRTHEDDPLLRQLDLADVFKRALDRIAPGVTMGFILANKANRRVVALRKELIIAGALHGYRGVEIARALNVAESVVSAVIVEMRPRPMVSFGRVPASF